MIIKKTEESIVDLELLDFLRDKKNNLDKEFEFEQKNIKWLIYRAQNYGKNPAEVILLQQVQAGLDLKTTEYKRICRSIVEVKGLLGIGTPRQDALDIEGAREYPITPLFELFGVIIKKGMCNCPFHEEDTPSCRVYDSTNSFYCFGCGAGGSPIDFVQKCRNCTFVEAVKELNQL